MRVGINEVLLYDRSSGARQREFNLMPSLIETLSANGHQAVVYLPKGLANRHIQTLTGSSGGAVLISTPVPALPTPVRILRGASYFGYRTWRDKLDLFHTNYYPIPPMHTPVVLTIHDVGFVYFPENYTKARLRFLRRVIPYSLRKAERIVAVSANTKKDLITKFGVPEAKIDVVPNPVNERFGRVVDSQRLLEVRAKYDLPKRYILYVGHLEPRKNLDRLIKAYLAVHGKQPDIPHLVILGKESFGVEAMMKDVKESDIGHKVRFTGYVDEGDLEAAYSMAEMLAFPSLFEGFGVPVLEAMACGIPVLTSNTTSLPEVAGDAALLVDPQDIDSIAEGLLELLNNESLRQRLVERGFLRTRILT